VTHSQLLSENIKEKIKKKIYLKNFTSVEEYNENLCCHLVVQPVIMSSDLPTDHIEVSWSSDAHLWYCSICV
jgi:hypothetical protein